MVNFNMERKRIRYQRVKALVLLILFICGTVGCANIKQLTNRKSASSDQSDKTHDKAFETDINIIAEVVIEGNDVLIKGNRALTYTSVKQLSPSAAINIYFPDTKLSSGETTIASTSPLIDTILTSQKDQKNPSSKITVQLHQDAPYKIVREGTNLRLMITDANIQAYKEGQTDTREASELMPIKTNPQRGAPQPTVASNDAIPIDSSQTSDNTMKGSSGQTSSIETKTATQINAFDSQIDPKHASIQILADGQIVDFKATTMDNPARIVLDLFDISFAEQKSTVSVAKNPYIKEVRVYTYPKRVRVIIDTKEEFLSAYKPISTKQGLSVIVGYNIPENLEFNQLSSQDVPEILEPPGSQMIEETSQIKDSKQTLVMSDSISFPPSSQTTSSEIPIASSHTMQSNRVPETKVQVSSGAYTPKKRTRAASIQGVDFIADEDGSSTVLVETSVPVEYKCYQSKESQVVLKLFHARIASHHQRILPTAFFKTAVDRIRPIRSSTNTVDVVMDLRENVAFHVEQEESKIYVHFDSSAIPPLQSKTKGWKDLEKPTPSIAPAPKITSESHPEDQSQNIPHNAPPIPFLSQKYRGEKIAIDFYETDIKNVFRILREVSGQNFAIDSDVSGRVTLSLKKPVPWDQILDLILKMNNLGMSYEGEIIRISQIATLKREEEERLRKIEAEKKANEALAPLITEYIPVNYAKASEIMKHLEGLLTKDRGSITVDERTNTIIITDTQDKINQALIMKKQLDKPTLQVMIETRIVEVTNNFSRDIGIDWSGQIGIQPGDAAAGIGPQRGYDILGGTYGYNWAINYPSTAKSSIGINFQRISGLTPLLLSAKLSAMESQGEVKIISAPRIVTLDNKEAVIAQGLEYPINKLDDKGNTVTEFKDVFLDLKVTPQITQDRRISMIINTSKNDLGPVVNGQQSFQTKQAKTELLVNDGDTVVIGGILKTRKDIGATGVPLFSKLPMIGWMFHTNLKKDDKEELLIFITPKIIEMEEPPSVKKPY